MPPAALALEALFCLCCIINGMIEVTRLNGDPFVLNSDHIESLEAAPDTIIKLTGGKTIIVRETVKEVIERVIEFRRRIHSVDVTVPEEMSGGEDE